MPFPQDPYPIYGKVLYRAGGYTVTLLNITTGESLTEVTESDGSFVLDPANLDSGYSDSDMLKVTYVSSYKFVVINITDYPDGRAANIRPKIAIGKRKGVFPPYAIRI